MYVVYCFYVVSNKQFCIKFKCVCIGDANIWSIPSNLNQTKDIKDIHLKPSTVIRHHVKQMYAKKHVI